MTKIIKVQSCETCPHIMGENCFIGDYEKDDERIIKDKTKIPDWCPLENLKE
jgi:hypothetical protein